jgi:hypothetical protein
VPSASGVPGRRVRMAKLVEAFARIDGDVHLFAEGPRMRYLSRPFGARFNDPRETT